MGRRALLAVFVVLLLVGTYGAYVVSYPKYPEVKGCVNPFKAVKPVTNTPENWSKAHVFLKLATSRDFWKLAKPWDVDYSHVKIVKHTLEYDGEKITMLKQYLHGSMCICRMCRYVRVDTLAMVSSVLVSMCRSLL